MDNDELIERGRQLKSMTGNGSSGSGSEGIPYGTLISALRAVHGIEQQPLADRSGIHRSTISRFEHLHEEPSDVQVLKIFRALAVLVRERQTKMIADAIQDFLKTRAGTG